MNHVLPLNLSLQMSRLRWHCRTEASLADVRQRWTPDALRGGTRGSHGSHIPLCISSIQSPSMSVAVLVLSGIGTNPSGATEVSSLCMNSAW